ncbi:prepilin-type cleavage/methylation domain-containing protein [Neobacillus drentensis]|uniref:prepilin-type cleavage/methylation domain-containing protein n=1 Tax=Neobacillus drentensis TaxID=220684 RepID=UPI003001C343
MLNLQVIELLAVIVILGIIAAIAIPAIGNIIDNSKKDAHVANAQQMASSARLAVTQTSSLQSGTQYIPLGYLTAQNLIDTIKDPDGGTYTDGGSAVLTSNPTGSYVKVEAAKVTEVKLVNDTRGIQSASTNDTSVSVSALSRGDVK